jgi:triacylglycerol lipase
MSAEGGLPIVLAHGIARFDVLAELLRNKLNLPDDEVGDHFRYFKGISSHLGAHGFEVFHPNQDFAGPVELRAAQLGARVREVIERTGAPQVHIIAHSMGGLDARHMIVDEGMAGRVASLTTIGTPHLGTVLADHLLKNGGFFLHDALRQVMKLDAGGFLDLSTEACDRFNRRAEDQEAKNGVSYRTYASAESINLVFTPLVPSWIFIREREGRNDGLVSFRSQQWKEVLIAHDGERKAVEQREFPLPADHLNQVGWWDPQEALDPSKLFQNVFKQAEEYEHKIRNIYLEIARNL